MRPPIARQLQLPTSSWRIGLGAALGLLAAAWIIILPFPLNLALVPAVLLALGYLLLPAMAALLLVLSVPVQTAGAVSMGGSQLTATKLALAATVLAVLVYLFARRMRPRGSVLFIPFGAYLLAMFISLHNAVSYGSAFTEIYRWVVTVFAFFLVLYCIRTRRALLAFPPVIALGVYFEVASGTLQSILKLGPSSFAVTQAISRAYGTFGKPNTYAGYLEMTGPLLLAVAIWSLGRSRDAWRNYREARLDGMLPSRHDRHVLAGWIGYTVWVGLAGCASLLGIALSFSRGAWLGILAGLAVMLLVSTRRFPIYRIGIVVLVAAFFASGAMHAAPTALKDRYAQLVNQVHLFDSREVMVTPKNFATVQRMNQWQAGIGMFERYPLTGVGIGNYNTRYPEFYVAAGFPVSAGHAHNYYIQAMSETGILGLLAYGSLIGTALIISLRATRIPDDALGRAIGLGSLGITIAVMVHDVVENLHVLNLGIELSAVWALAVIVLRYRPEPLAIETVTKSRQPTDDASDGGITGRAKA